MKLDTYKIHLKLCRSFSLGVQVHSPKLNGLAFDLLLGCIHLAIWSRGKKLFGATNYWRG